MVDYTRAALELLVEFTAAAKKVAPETVFVTCPTGLGDTVTITHEDRRVSLRVLYRTGGYISVEHFLYAGNVWRREPPTDGPGSIQWATDNQALQLALADEVRWLTKPSERPDPDWEAKLEQWRGRVEGMRNAGVVAVLADGRLHGDELSIVKAEILRRMDSVYDN